MKTHELKAWPECYEPVRKGLKTYEFRLNDRGFQVGDLLLLREWEPTKKQYTGRQMVRKVTYVCFGGIFGIPTGHCIMSIVPSR